MCTRERKRLKINRVDQLFFIFSTLCSDIDIISLGNSPQQSYVKSWSGVNMIY